MGYDDRREILERLEALERRLGARRDERGGDAHRRDGGCERHDHRGHGCARDDHHAESDFDEKRVIDTIVRLVSEQVGRLLEELQAQSRGQDEGGGEKRIVDLIVGRVSEHVQEIVATELDRRLGRPPLTNPDRPPSDEPA